MHETGSSMIEIVDLKKSYGEVVALSGLNFSVPKGQIVGFLGPNGAGKSTTMKILTGYLPYSSGSVKVDGIEVAHDPISARNKIGYLPENNPQYEDMMVFEYLSFIADIRVPKEKKEKIEKAIFRCGLKEVVHKDISQLSKGYRQRVGLAQAILHEPELLILDEPTSGLDPNQILDIRNLIKELGKQTTILMSTHILQEAQSSCERILIINNGLLVADDTPEELVTGAEIMLEVSSRDGAAFDSAILLQRIIDLGCEIVSHKNEAGSLFLRIRSEKPDIRREIFLIVVDLGLVLLSLKRQKVALEDTFRRLTKGL
jgi:ABC-2 type transport system ATP-binding protein